MRPRHTQMIFGFIVGLLVGCSQPSVGPQVPAGFGSDPTIFRGAYETTADLRTATASVSVAAHGSLLAMARGDGLHAIQLWDTERGRALRTLGDELYEDEVILTPDAKLVAAALEDDVRVWAVQSGEQRYSLSPRSPSCQQCWPSVLAVSPDSSTLASLSVGEKSELGLFDLNSGERTATLPLPDPEVLMKVLTSPARRGYLDLRFGPDGTRLASFRDTTTDGVLHVRVWSVPSGEVLGDYQLETAIPLHFDAHLWADGVPVLGVATQAGIDLVKVDDGELVQRLADFPDQKQYAGHKNVVELYASPDGRRMLGYYTTYDESLGEEVGGLALWDLADGRFLLDVPGARGAAGFSPDGRYALSLGVDGLALRDPDTLIPIRTLVSGKTLPLQVEAQATYQSQDSYQVQGTFTFADAAPLPFAGQVRKVPEFPGSPTSRLKDELEVRFRYQNSDWLWRAYPEPHDGRPAWRGTLERATGTPYSPTYYDLTLEPTG